MAAPEATAAAGGNQAGADPGVMPVKATVSIMPGTPQPAAVARPAPRRAGHHELLLSTFMLLTAFFAVLVSLSDFEPRRTRLALNSIAQVFAAEVPPARAMPFSAADERARFAAPVEDLRRLLERSLAVSGEAATVEGERMYVEFPATRLFEAGGPAIRQERQVMLGRVAQLLAGGNDAWRPTLHVAADLQDNAGIAPTLARLQAVERRLRQLGADPDRIVLGLTASGSGRWRFEFRTGD